MVPHALTGSTGALLAASTILFASFIGLTAAVPNANGDALRTATKHSKRAAPDLSLDTVSTTEASDLTSRSYDYVVVRAVLPVREKLLAWRWVAEGNDWSCRSEVEPQDSLSQQGWPKQTTRSPSSRRAPRGMRSWIESCHQPSRESRSDGTACGVCLYADTPSPPTATSTASHIQAVPMTGSTTRPTKQI
jgi:hypothetical protein